MVKSWRKPVTVTSGFLKWFSTRRGIASGQTPPVEIWTSESSTFPLLTDVISSTTGASPFLAQSGTHPVPLRAPSTIPIMVTIAFALIFSSPIASGSTASISASPPSS